VDQHRQHQIDNLTLEIMLLHHHDNHKTNFFVLCIKKQIFSLFFFIIYFLLYIMYKQSFFSRYTPCQIYLSLENVFSFIFSSDRYRRSETKIYKLPKTNSFV
jgi:hypothetical protein